MPLYAAFRVDTLKMRWASSTCYGFTMFCKWILAIASERRMMASSCLTVMGMPVLFFEIF
jgi:hypothetical protein